MYASMAQALYLFQRGMFGSELEGQNAYWKSILGLLYEWHPQRCLTHACLWNQSFLGLRACPQLTVAVPLLQAWYQFMRQLLVLQKLGCFWPKDSGFV